MSKTKALQTHLLHLFTFFIMLAFLNLMMGCTTFYKARSVDLNDKQYIEKVFQYDQNKYQFFLHSGELMWGLDSVTLAENLITGKLSEFNSEEKYYFDKLKGGSYNARVPNRDKEFVYQVHVYTEKFTKKGEQVIISEKDITGVNVYNINGGLTTLTRVGTAGLITIGAIGVFLVIACNCPHVYTFDGNSYNYNNTLFTGAVSDKIERFDYKLMPDYFPESEDYSIIIKNENTEKQYANVVALIVVQHAKNTQVYPDQNGKLHAVSNPILPLWVKDDNGTSISEAVGYIDEVAYAFDSNSETDFSDTYAEFNMPANRENAKLILRARNSVWGGFVYNEFSKLFGSYHDNWVKKNQRNSQEEMEKRIKEQGISLSVSIKKEGQWIEIEDIDLIGDIAYNTLAVPINSKFLNSDSLEIRVRSGFMFWKLDYMALDFTPDYELDIQYPELIKATGSAGIDHTQALASDDSNYMGLLAHGDSSYIEFKGLPHSPQKERTIILRSKGYYLPQSEMSGKPAWSELVKFRKEGELSRYSRGLYELYFNGLTMNFE